MADVGMMAFIAYIVVGLSLPLFPLSMLFNILYGRTRNPLLRSLLLLIWPQIGVILVSHLGLSVPAWLITWSILTSLLYAFRMLALREVGLWTSFVAVSAWGLLWLLHAHGAEAAQLEIYSLGVSVPLILMACLTACLERRFGAAYLGLYGGLAQSIPRFSAVLVVVVLAVIATPLFPTFFAMLTLILKAIPAAPLEALGVAVVWLLWSWAGARLLQGLIVGPVRTMVPDMNYPTVWLYIGVLGGLLSAGVYWSGLML
jgi:NADH:ubiquinone oxidoreductase subunit 4 (subunit M)